MIDTGNNTAGNEPDLHRAQLAAIVESSSDAIYSYDFQGRVLTWNGAAEQLYGFSAGEILGQNILAIMPPELVSETAHIISSIQENQPLVSLMTERLRKDGSRFSAQIRASPIHNTEGKPIALSVIARDVTERLKFLNASLMLSTIVESSNDAIVSKNLSGTILSWNAAAERLFGYRPEEIIGKPVTLLLPPDRLKEEEQILARIQRGEAFRSHDTVRVTKDGRLVNVAITVSPLIDSNGKIVGASKIVRDNTARKRAEAELRRSEQLLRLGMKVADYAIAQVDYRSDTITLSKEAALLYGLDEATKTIPREQIHATFHPDDRAVVEKYIAEAKDPKGDGIFRHEHRIARADGQVRWLNVQKQVFFDLGSDPPKPSHAILAAQDVTDRKQAELDALFLSALAAEIRLDSSPEELTRKTILRTAEYLGVDRAGLAFLTADRAAIELGDDYLMRGQSISGLYRLDWFDPAIFGQLRNGQPLAISDAQTEPATAGQYQSFFEPLGLRALLCIPLIRRGQWEGVLWVAEAKARTWAANEIKLLETAAERIWLAVEGARLQTATRELNNTLEARVLQRTKELEESQAQLRELSAYAERMRENERMRIAREVHDQLGGSLTILKIGLQRVGRDHADDSSIASAMEDMRGQVDELIHTVRRIASDLRPPMLDDFGLVATLEWQAAEWAKRTGTRCNLDLPADEPALTAERRTAMFRVFQESLTNITRHARATQVRVSLRVAAGQAVLEVRDNGLGIPDDTLRQGKSLGLLGMRERLREVSGDLEFTSSPGAGTTVRIRTPLG